VIEANHEDSPFHYLDTGTTNAGIGAVTDKLRHKRIAIIGLGGTGSYVLDLIAKTPVQEIALFDGDTYLQHNAFRSPGAPSIATLKTLPLKVDYWKAVYSAMHRHIVAHGTHVDVANVDELRDMNFVFVCIDSGDAKSLIVEKLEEFGIPFVDVGMGVELVDDSLIGTVRVTTSTPAKRDHVRGGHRIPFAGNGRDDLYSRNIQIADLNALNAALAVVKWKKYCGFYKDLEGEHFCAYSVDGNHMLNEDAA
jgi:hypothetical protein